MVARVYGLPIKVAILNNQFLGMVRQWQEMFHENRYSQVDLEAAPDFVKLADAFDCVGCAASGPRTSRRRSGRRWP